MLISGRRSHVRWNLRWLVLGVLAGACCVPALAREPNGGGIKPSGAATCGDHGTSVHFEKTPKEAAQKALKEEKLVFVVHVSGIFEDTELT